MKSPNTELDKAIKELVAIIKNLQIENANLLSRVYYLEQYTGLSNGISKPVLTPEGVSLARMKYSVEGRLEEAKEIAAKKFTSELLNSALTNNAGMYSKSKF